MPLMRKHEASPTEATMPAAAAPQPPPASPEPLAAEPTWASPAIAPASPARLDELALDLAFRRLERPALGVRATFELRPRLYLGTALHLSLIPDRETLRDGGTDGHSAGSSVPRDSKQRIGSAAVYLRLRLL